mmetsp:Transcript_17185/g.35877  ORF Transcript_17185/g.35877 Transcript_17185/m.35877 type:complete len:177 (+) Transcript_17185:254-784(+)|eukprot:CAMPEP_0171348110 /NCGR_PEP_ID=MMETSP0878-20121228/29903_1 /TAXON_ID=67004 /ORGANISM="Thalassiosira weissflogii, Strain CCMP1336" /LENGTH=176 /DNA_ID=CAMNT_0011852349 /DNA_START=284 /DNA_END=814 /DNA_ORIENTATION=+
MMILTAILIDTIFVLSSSSVSIVSAATSMESHVSSPSYLRGYYQRNDYNPHSIIDPPIKDAMTDENDKSDGDDDDPKLTDCLLSAVSATDCGSILPKCIWCKEPIAGLCVTESAARKMNLMPFFTCSLRDDLDDGDVDVADERGGEGGEVDEEQSGGEYDEVELEYGNLDGFAEET